MALPRRSLFGLMALVLVVLAAGRWLGHGAAADVGAEMAAVAQPGDIHMVASETCAYCAQARAWFTEHKVAFSECLIEQDTQCATAYRAFGAPGTPLMLIRGQPQLGFNPERILKQLG